MLEPKFDDITFFQKRQSVNDRKKIECKTEIATENVSKVIGVYLLPSIVKSSVDDGLLEYEGVATCFVCYEDKDGNLQKGECTTSFNGQIKSESITNSTNASVYVSVEKTESQLSFANLSIISNLFVWAEISDKQTCKALLESDELITNGKEIEIIKEYGVKNSMYPIEEEFEVSSAISQVLSQCAEGVITSVQSGVGCIILDGKILFKAIFLQSDEKRDIIRECRTFPFRIELECEEAMPTMNALARLWVKSIKTNVSVDNEKNCSLVNCTVVLNLEGQVYSNESVGITLDAFSKTHNLELITNSISHHNPNQLKSEQVQIKGRGQTEELPVGATLVCVSSESIQIALAERTEKGMNISGTLQATVLFRDMEGRLFSRKLETAFSQKLDAIVPNCFEVLSTPESCSAKMISSTELELSCVVVFTVYSWEEDRQTLISAVKLLEEKRACESAISVYIPTKNEQLWSLAKRLNVSPQELLETNQELQFPLSGNERIVVFRGR